MFREKVKLGLKNKGSEWVL